MNEEQKKKYQKKISWTTNQQNEKKIRLLFENNLNEIFLFFKCYVER